MQTQEHMTDVVDTSTDQVARLLTALKFGPMSVSELMGKLGFSHRPTSRINYLYPGMGSPGLAVTIRS
ncbi:MAG: hypothetical protein K9M57_08665 [Phycisphaerae bacterium]|nr:hypothetical protein [Phycisphaerae bacterium]